MELEVDVPRPNKRCKYPFSQMEIGNSFFVGTEMMIPTNIAGAAYAYGKRNGKKFSVSFQYDDTPQRNICGVRVWRVA
jgi:hypothetical protein